MAGSASNIDATRIFDSAEAFFHAVYSLKDSAERGNPNILQMVVAVNSAFALELYLKCLIAIERGSFAWGHDLRELYYQLSSEARSDIEMQHRKLENTSDVFALARARGVETDVASLLNLGRNAFELFRYAFEDGAEDAIWGLDGVTLLVRKRILERHLDMPSCENVCPPFLPGWAQPATDRSFRSPEN